MSASSMIDSPIPWYRRPAVWIASAALILGVAYAVGMQVMLSDKTRQITEIVANIETQKAKVEEARQKMMALPDSPQVVERALQRHQSRNQRYQKDKADVSDKLAKLKQDKRLQVYLEKSPQLEALLEQCNELRRQLEEKNKEYKKRVQETRS